MVKNRSDAELLAAHVTGDRYAFEALFHRHHRHLYRRGAADHRRPEDAADALQNVLSALRGSVVSPRRRRRGRLAYRIVVNACLDRLRRAVPPRIELFDDTWKSVTAPRRSTPRSWCSGR